MIHMMSLLKIPPEARVSPKAAFLSCAIGGVAAFVITPYLPEQVPETINPNEATCSVQKVDGKPVSAKIIDTETGNARYIFNNLQEQTDGTFQDKKGQDAGKWTVRPNHLLINNNLAYCDVHHQGSNGYDSRFEIK